MISQTAFWIAGETPLPDTYAAMRGKFQVDGKESYQLRLLGASWYAVWLDGQFLAEGPFRYPPERPEYQELAVSLSPGTHVLAVKVAHIGAATRLLQDLSPFMLVSLFSENGSSIDIQWRGIEFPGHIRTGRRINGQLGWMEYLDKSRMPTGWKLTDFKDDNWPEVVHVEPPIGARGIARLGAVKSFRIPGKQVGGGLLAERFGYRLDDPPTQFFLRDLEAKSNPAQGFWRRYDLGRVRLAKPDFEIEAPEGTLVQFAWSEHLLDGRVTPWISLSSGQSCNMDAFITRAGRQTLCPLQPKGGRFIELHVIGVEQNQVRFVREDFIERGYHGPAEGSFECSDHLLNRIWEVGVETYRACTEDAVIDNPTRERGQWTGDVVTVGMDICSVAYADLRLIRRGLVQSAQCAREDGLVAGLCPGGVHYHPPYSAQWVNACLRYWVLTGERSLLSEMWSYARANMAAFERFRNEMGVGDSIGHIFIDWGYKRNDGPADLAFNMHYLNALRGMEQWANVMGDVDAAAAYELTWSELRASLLRFVPAPDARPAAWKALGYHSTVLAIANGLVEPAGLPSAVKYLKAHMLECFPNDPAAPRNAAPEVAQPRLITPYFAHYAFPVLIEADEMEFVLEQYRRCWGWALQEDRTTWVEVFDTRWTHCHQWAGCPTWQLSRYGLGLHTRRDLGPNTFELLLSPGNLDWARGSLPLGDDEGLITIEWKREAGVIRYRLTSAAAIEVRVRQAGDNQSVSMAVKDEATWELDQAGRFISAAVMVGNQS